MICRGGLPKSAKVIVTFVEVPVLHDSRVLFSGFSAKACAGRYGGACLGKGKSVDSVCPDSELVMDHWYRRCFGG